MASSLERGATQERNPSLPVGDIAARAPPAPEQLAVFNQLLEKIVTAGRLCRHARQLELAGRAAAQAELLYREDSLVVAWIRETESSALWSLSCDAVDAGADAEEEALDRQAWALLLPLHALLLRRVAANTLLPGTVRQEESEFGANMDAAARRAARAPAPAKARLRVAGQLMGYDVLLDVVINTVKLLGSRRWPRAQEASAQSFVLAALDVIPRTAGCVHVVTAEGSVVHVVELMSEDPVHPAYRDVDAAFRNALLRKWRSPAISDVLRSRGSLQRGSATHLQNIDDFDARQRADIAEIGLRECVWPSCDKVERTVREFKQCSGCRSVWYCSPEHHRLDWGEHRKACGELDAARRTAAPKIEIR